VGQEAVEGCLTGGRASAQKGGGEGMVRAKRRSVGGVGFFTECGAAFYRAEVMRGGRVPSMASVEGASMPTD
jgi:hypothetical protein